eukprot:COSAG06_NODE_1700_length_8675_cov_3.485774_2_plen_82_part_00
MFVPSLCWQNDHFLIKNGPKVPFSYRIQAAARSLCQTLLLLPKGSELNDKALQKTPSVSTSVFPEFFVSTVFPVFVPSPSW